MDMKDGGEGTSMRSRTTERLRRFARWTPAIGLLALLSVAAFLASCGRPEPAAEVQVIDDAALARFEAKVGSLRDALRIPGISAAIVHQQEIVWAAGFGHADLENDIAATPETPYGVASVTKPFAAFVLMRAVEDGRLDLNARATDFGIDLGAGGITVRHLLSHTSEDDPGSHYQYSGNRYSTLTAVIEEVYGAPFRRVLRDEILGPLGMNDSALNVGGCGLAYYMSTLAEDDPERAFEHVYREAAVPYLYDAEYAVYPGGVPSYANAAAGLISTVGDLAAFAIAVERDELVSAETKALMFAPTTLTSGEAGPYGLGWFAERYGDDGTALIWHYGYGAYSSLLLMIPSEQLTFIILANSQNMSRPFALGNEDVSVLGSPFALAFFKEFVLRPRRVEILPEIEWRAGIEGILDQLDEIDDPELRELYEDELWTTRKLYGGVGETLLASQLLLAHPQAFPEAEVSTLDRYQAGRPGPRPEQPHALTAAEAARWAGNYVLRPEYAELGLPPKIELLRDENRIIGVTAVDDCQIFYAVSPYRLRSASNPELFLIVDDVDLVDDDGPFASGSVEHQGQIIAIYDRVEQAE